MEITSTPFFTVPMVFAVAGVGYLFLASYKAKWARPSREAMALAGVPSLLCLLMFYALAMHMHWSLSGWPGSIGNKGFSEALDVHAGLTMLLFYLLLMGTLFVWPVLFFSFDPFRVASFFESPGCSRDILCRLFWGDVAGTGAVFVLVVGLNRCRSA